MLLHMPSVMNALFAAVLLNIVEASINDYIYLCSVYGRKPASREDVLTPGNRRADPVVWLKQCLSRGISFVYELLGHEIEIELESVL